MLYSIPSIESITFTLTTPHPLTLGGYISGGQHPDIDESFSNSMIAMIGLIKQCSMPIFIISNGR